MPSRAAVAMALCRIIFRRTKSLVATCALLLVQEPPCPPALILSSSFLIPWTHCGFATFAQKQQWTSVSHVKTNAKTGQFADQITHTAWSVLLPSYPPSEWGGDDVAVPLMPSERLALPVISRERSHGARCTGAGSLCHRPHRGFRKQRTCNGSPPNSVTGLP